VRACVRACVRVCVYMCVNGIVCKLMVPSGRPIINKQKIGNKLNILGENVAIYLTGQINISLITLLRLELKSPTLTHIPQDK